MHERILAIWSRVETALIGVLVLCALGTFLGGAVLRHVSPRQSIDWADEVALYFIVWATALAGSVLAAEGRHINTEILLGGLSSRARRALGLAVGALTLGFCATMAVYGWQAYEFSAMLDDRSGSSLRTPQSWALFLALPVGMALIVAKMLMLALAGRGITASGKGH